MGWFDLWSRHVQNTPALQQNYQNRQQELLSQPANAQNQYAYHNIARLLGTPSNYLQQYRAENPFMLQPQHQPLQTPLGLSPLGGPLPGPSPTQPAPFMPQQAPLNQLMTGLQANPVETYESMKAKYGVQAARDWERNR